MRDNHSGNRRTNARYATDRFVPAVVAAEGGGRPLGGHIVDVSMGGARMVAAPNLVTAPEPTDAVVLVIARSDGNRELDIDGLRIPCEVVQVREPPGARVIRLRFTVEAPPRLRRWLHVLAREGTATHSEGLPEFDPDVWAGWAAISPGMPAP